MVGIKHQLTYCVDIVWFQKFCISQSIQKLDCLSSDTRLGISGSHLNHPWSETVCECSECSDIPRILEQNFQLFDDFRSSLRDGIRENPSQVSQVLTFQEHLSVDDDPVTQ